MKKMQRLILRLVTVSAVLSTLVVGAASAVEPVGESSLPPGTWVSGTQVQNVGTKSATVMLVYHSEDGTTMHNGAAISVAPGASGTFYLEPGVPDGFFGSAVAYSSEPSIAVTNVDNLSTGARGSYNGFEAGAGQVNFPLVKREYWGASTLIFIQNTDTEGVTVTASYKRGAETWTGSPVPINAGFMKEFSPADAGVPTGFVGSAVFAATGDIAGAYVEYMGNTASVGTGFPSGVESTKIYVPLVKKFYWGAATGIQVQNVGTVAAPISVTYKSTGGVEYVSSVGGGADVEPGASRTYYLDPVLPGSAGSPDGFLGSAIITSPQPIVAIVNEAQLDGSAASTHAGINDGLQTTKISVPLVKKFYWGAATGIQVQNVGTVAAPISVTYKSTGGVEYVSSVGGGADVEPGASRTYYLDPVLPGAQGSFDGFIGSAIITSSQNIVAIVNELMVDDLSIATTHSGINDGIQTTKVAVPLVKKFYWGAATGIQVQNVGTVAAPISVTYKSTGGVEYVSSVGGGADVEPGASRTYYLDPVLPGSAGSPDGFLGAAIITSPQPIVAIVNEWPVDVFTTGDGMSTNAFNLTP